MPGASKAGAKRETVAALTESFSSSNATVLTEYRGLTVAQLRQLRQALGATTSYEIVKNTLTKIAAKDAGVTVADDLLAGPTALAFVKGDVVEAAKALRTFTRENPLLVVKGGVLDGKPLTAAEITKLADLESREVLLAKLAGALNATTAKAAALFQAPLSQAARLAEALRAKAEADPSILAGGAGTPAAVPADEPVATASEGGSVTLTVDDAAAVEIGEPAPADNSDAPAEADTAQGAGVDTGE